MPASSLEEIPLFMSRMVAAALLLLGGSGCAVDRAESMKQSAVATETAAVPSRDIFALGTAVTAEGAVPRDASGQTFSRGGEVFLSINVDGASVEQDIEVKWIGPTGEVLHHDEIAVPKGAQYAAFSSGDTKAWTPGPHRAVVLINGRRVSERPFDVM